jgi:hypothetical protein
VTAQPHPSGDEPAYRPPAAQEYDQRNVRMSTADRDQIVDLLNSALSAGRLTLAEFDERVAGVQNAKTYAEVEPYLKDLPVALAPTAPPRDVVELGSVASSIKRRGRWNVPRRLVVRNKAGSVKLDFSEAVISLPVVEVELDVMAGSTELILPAGATADLDDVRMFAGSAASKVPTSYDAPAAGIRFVVTGSCKAGSLKVRYRYRFWRWSW